LREYIREITRNLDERRNQWIIEGIYFKGILEEIYYRVKEF
jgi:hypothetical protein